MRDTDVDHTEESLNLEKLMKDNDTLDDSCHE